MNSNLIYVAPRESMNYILNRGILTPSKIQELISLRELPREVLGVSFGQDSSNFPNHVSLLENSNIARSVAEQICFSRTGSYTGDFMAIGYSIKSQIRTSELFIPNFEVKKMNPDCYTSEVLYFRDIPRDLIEHHFAVRLH